MKRSHFLFILLIFLSIIVRFPFADTHRFEHEMVRDIQIGERISTTPLFHGVLGKDSTSAVQQSFGPLYYYLIHFSLLFSPSVYYYPLMPYYLTMLFNLFSILLCFFLCKSFFNERIAFIASFFYALSPWVVLHVSNVLTTPNFLPFFVLLSFYSYYQILYKKNLSYFLPFFVSIALQLQLHLSTLLLLPAYATLFFVDVSLFKKKETYIYGSLSLLLFIPFIYTLSTQGDTSVFSFIGNRYESTYLANFIDASAIPTLYVTPYLGTYLLGFPSHFQSSLASFFFYLIVLCMVIAFIASVCYVLVTFFKSPHSKKNVFLPILFWFFIPVFLAFILKKNISPHYLIILLPVQFIFIGVFFDALIRRFSSFRYVPLILLGYFVFFLFSFYHFADTYGTEGIFGTPYKQKVALVDSLITLHPDGHFSLSYYGISGKEFNYLFHLRGVTPQTQRLDSLLEFTEGYLLTDPRGFYAFHNPPSEETLYISSFPAVSFYQYDLYAANNETSLPDL